MRSWQTIKDIKCSKGGLGHRNLLICLKNGRETEKEDGTLVCYEKKKKSLKSSVVVSLPLLAGPKVEKCLAHLLSHPPGEDISTIWNEAKIENETTKRWGENNASQQSANNSRKATNRSLGLKQRKKVEGEEGNTQLTKVAQASYIKHLLPLPVLVIAHDCKQVSDKNLKKDETNRASFKDHQSRPCKLRYY